jgi:hypothetical protein
VRFYRAGDAEPKQWRCGYRIWRYALQETVARRSSYRRFLLLKDDSRKKLVRSNEVAAVKEEGRE